MSRFITGISAVLVSCLFPEDSRALMPPPTNNNWVEAGEYIFRQGELLEVHITFDHDPTGDPNTVIECASETPLPATVRIKNSVMDETITTCGVRNRGTYSRCNPNRSWDVSFDEFVDDRKFHGVDGFDLKSEAFDPTSSRSWASWQLFASMGVPASRCVAARVYVNGQYYGLQSCLESSDKSFMRAWFGNGEGTRFKCGSIVADLAWRGPDRDAYDGVTNLGDDAQGYELKSKNLEQDYANLIELIDFINNTSKKDFRAGIGERLDVDSFLRWLAVNMALGSYDDYWNASNNYGLYLPPGSTRWQWIPYDYDLTLGMAGGMKADFARKPFDKRWKKKTSFGTGKAPLTERLLAIPEYAEQFRRYVHEFSATFYSDENFRTLLDPHIALIGDSVETDPRDAFEPEEFLAGFDLPSRYLKKSAAIQYGIYPFVATRNVYITKKVKRPAPLSTVVINEVVASNSSGAQDEAGEYEDWVELHNPGSVPVDLSGMYLSDKLNDPRKWTIPAGTLVPAGGYLVFWCDEDEDQGPYHTNFKLSADGEGVGLFHRDASLNLLLSGVCFPEMADDEAFARRPDGTYGKTLSPTPAAVNAF